MKVNEIKITKNRIEKNIENKVKKITLRKTKLKR